MNFRDSLVRLIKSQCLQTPRMMAEVGVHKGATSKRLLTEFPRMHLYLVDFWAEATTRTNDPITQLTAEEQENCYAKTLDNVRHFPTRHEILRMDSCAAIAHMQPLDVAFIDCDHSFVGCTRDCNAYWSIVRENGLLCGHDYGKSDLPGVSLAVNGFVEARGVELHVEEGSIWWCRKIQ